MNVNYKKQIMLSVMMLVASLCFLSAQVAIDPPLSFFDFEGDITDSGTAGNDMDDANALSGALTDGGVTSAAEETDGCYEFTGGEALDYLTLPWASYLNAESHTFAIWVKYSATLSEWGGYLFWTDGPLFANDNEGVEFERRIDLWTHKGTEWAPYGIINQLDPSGADAEMLRVSAATEDFDGDDFLTDEAWHLVVATLEDSENSKLYVDGQLLGDEVAPSTILLNTKEGDAWIGARPGGTTSLEAKIDRLRFWDQVLTSEQIEALFAYDGGDASAVTWGGELPISNKVGANVELLSSSPNPTNGLTNIQFSLLDNSTVNISVLDISGKEVASVTNEFMSVGKHNVQFDASNLSDGMYIINLQTKDANLTQKMTVSR